MGNFSKIIAAAFVLVTFQWAASSPTDDVVLYRIYQDNAGEIVAIADTPAPPAGYPYPETTIERSVEIPPADLAASEYFVTAIDAHGHESRESDRVFCGNECRAAFKPRKLTGVGLEGER